MRISDWSSDVCSSDLVPRQICDPLSGLDAIAHLKGLISMKKLLTLAVATTALVSVPAFAADTDTVDLLVNATVLDECSIENPTDVTFATVNINAGAGANALILKNGHHIGSEQCRDRVCQYV